MHANTRREHNIFRKNPTNTEMALKSLEHGDLCTEGLASHVPGCVGPTFTRNCINNEESNKMII